MSTQERSQWRPIKTFRGRDYHEVDLWLRICASPMSMGMADSFRVVEAYKVDGKWFHRDPTRNFQEAELNSYYITHWMPIPKGPK